MKIQEGKFWALIPARGGSKGVPRKNIKPLGGYPLIAYSIAACRLSERISRIIVSTDDDEIAEIARYYGAEVPFMRPKEVSGDRSTDYEFVDHALTWFENNEKAVSEYLVHIRATTPLRNPKVLDEALKQFDESKEYTSMRSAHKASESPYKWFLMNDDGTYRSVSDGMDNESANNGRSEFPDVFIPDGYVDVLKTKFVLENKILHGTKMMAFESPWCMEVDTPEDFDYLEYQLKRDGSQLYDYLKSEYSIGGENGIQI